MDWQELLPVHSLSSLLERYFFPKWLQILTMWLNHAPNYDEITNWYMGWKGMMSEPLLAQPAVKGSFVLAPITAIFVIMRWLLSNLTK
jgi:tuftelin-interacting protein 11